MVNIWRVMSYEISRTLRRKGYLFATFALPFLLFALSFVWQRLAPTPEQMMRDAQTIQTLGFNPWIASSVFFIIAAVLGFNFLGDGVRDAADPYSIS